MNTNEWLEQNAMQVKSGIPDDDALIWVTKSRGDYITRAGMEDKLPIAQFGITDYVGSTWEAGKPINMGFNPLEQKWYGWSHRAIYGFGIGSTCKRGDVHYRPTDKDDFLQDMIRFWTEADHLNVVGEHREDGVYVEWETSQNVPNEKARGQISGCTTQYPDEYGRGEWTAETLADARQMAIDFANNIA